MADLFGLGDPDACERAATDCELAARQLDGPIQRLTSLRLSVGGAWTGTAGDSLVSSVDQRRQTLVTAQKQLTDAASSLRTAAAQIREAARKAQARARKGMPPVAMSHVFKPLESPSWLR